MGRLLGLDFGEKRVGVALSDEEKKYAFVQETINYRDPGQLLASLKELCRQEGVEKIILGLPCNLKGEKTAQTKKVENFARRLKEAAGRPVIFQDERMTSRLSQSLFWSKSQKIKVTKNQINAQSARIILQDYLDRASLLNKA